MLPPLTRHSLPPHADAKPDVVAFALCGFSLAASQALAQQAMQQLAEAGGGAVAGALARARVIVTDGLHVFSRPGPWLVQSLEVLVEALHGEAQGYGHEGSLWAPLEGRHRAAAAAVTQT